MTRIGRRHIRLLALPLMIALVVGVVRSNAASTSHLEPLYKNEDSFENYDFTSQRVASNNVDFPMTLVFFNANQGKVNSALNGQYPNGGDPEHARMNDGGGWFWNANSGRKNSFDACTGTDSGHYRVYARGDQGHNYNSSWGYWVAATTHRDHLECSPGGLGTWFGYSEDAERYVYNDAKHDLGSRYVNTNSHKWHNNEDCPRNACRKQADHIWQNDGWATAISLP
jgi:hypothetical protein